MSEMKEKELDVRFNKLEKQLDGFISPDKFNLALNEMAKNDEFTELKRIVETLEKSSK